MIRRWLLKQAVLWWCNWQRIRQRRLPVLSLRQGTRWSPESCPVANTVGARITRNGWWFADEFWTPGPWDSDRIRAAKKPLPRFVTRFTQDVDFGEYPELIGRA